MLAAQDGRCPICLRKLVEKPLPPVDHEHTTGRIRGIPCGSCNRAIGMLRDDPDNFRRGAEYLLRHLHATAK